MRTNSALTLYNKYYDPSTKQEKYQRWVLVAVEWEDTKASNVLATGGEIAANQAVIYIPMTLAPAYLEPKDWLGLTDKSLNWTLQVGDLVVKGAIAEEIGDTFTPTNLKANYDHVLTIKSVDEFDMGSFTLRHWKVGAQ